MCVCVCVCEDGVKSQEKFTITEVQWDQGWPYTKLRTSDHQIIRRHHLCPWLLFLCRLLSISTDENWRWKFENSQIILRMTHAVLRIQFKVTLWPQFLIFPAFASVVFFQVLMWATMTSTCFSVSGWSCFFSSSLSVKSWYITKIHPTQRPYTVPVVFHFTNWYNSRTSVKWLLGNTMLSWEKTPKAEWYQSLPASAASLWKDMVRSLLLGLPDQLLFSSTATSMKLLFLSFS